jgi:hypothetical protein
VKIVFSPLISGASGRTGGAVFSNWKGRAYVRRYTVPAYRETAAQIIVRDGFTRCVPLWRSMSASLKTVLNTYGSGYQQAGYGIFMSLNRKLESLNSLLVPLPPNPLVSALAGFAYDSEPGAGQLKVVWTTTVQTGYTKVATFLRRTDRTYFEQELLTTLESAHLLVFSGLTSGKTYQVYCAPWHTSLVKAGTIASLSHLQAT